MGPDGLREAERRFSPLDQATEPDAMDVASDGFRALAGDRAGRLSIVGSRDGRITCGFDGADAVGVDPEDVHG